MDFGFGAFMKKHCITGGDIIKNMPGLYVHLPFCVKKCHYCNFVIALKGSSAREIQFLEIFEKEVLHRAKDVGGKKFDTLYFGGGTPSALEEKNLTRAFSLIRSHFKFKKNTEVTLEANPGDISAALAKNLKALGVQRVSLGAQSFHEKTLKLINRSHGAKEIYTSFENLRNAGFDNINLDLMLSLPGETLADLQFSLSQLKLLNPDHVSIYELVLENKTVFKKRFEKGKLPLPDEDLQTLMLQTARAFLKNNGWHPYELLNYAKKGKESTHNKIYWRNEEYLGLGPGAFSYLDRKRFQYAATFEEYMQKVAANNWTNFEEEILSAEKKESESFLLALRTKSGADLKKFHRWIKKNEDSAQELTQKGLIQKKKGKIQLTDRGQLFAETVFSEFSSGVS